MNSFKTLIIDDERLAREELKNLLKGYDEIEIIGEARDGVDGIEQIKALQPDLIFLDINMPGMDGFEMLSKLEDMPMVIFVTAYNEYAHKAFEIKALDYITKPVDPARLKEAIQKVLDREREEGELTSESVLVNNEILKPTDKVFIKDGEKCFFIELQKIRVFESDGNYIKVYFDNHRPMILRSLNNLESRLDTSLFFRANRKFIVNLNFITHVEVWFNGGFRLTMQNGDFVEVSRRQAIRFKEIFSL